MIYLQTSEREEVSLLVRVSRTVFPDGNLLMTCFRHLPKCLESHKASAEKAYFPIG